MFSTNLPSIYSPSGATPPLLHSSNPPLCLLRCAARACSALREAPGARDVKNAVPELVDSMNGRRHVACCRCGPVPRSSKMGYPKAPSHGYSPPKKRPLNHIVYTPKSNTHRSLSVSCCHILMSSFSHIYIYMVHYSYSDSGRRTETLIIGSSDIY